MVERGDEEDLHGAVPTASRTCRCHSSSTSRRKTISVESASPRTCRATRRSTAAGRRMPRPRLRGIEQHLPDPRRQLVVEPRPDRRLERPLRPRDGELREVRADRLAQHPLVAARPHAVRDAGGECEQRRVEERHAGLETVGHGHLVEREQAVAGQPGGDRQRVHEVRGLERRRSPRGSPRRRFPCAGHACRCREGRRCRSGCGPCQRRSTRRRTRAGAAPRRAGGGSS